MTTTIETTEETTTQRDALVGRLFSGVLAMMDIFTSYVGERLGLYRSLADDGPATPAQLSARAGIHERYAREWLEQQAATGILTVDDAAAEAASRRYSLPAGHAEVMLDADSLSYFGGIIRLAVGATGPIAAVLDAYRTGGGVPYTAYGADTREGIANMNRPMFINLLGSEWLPAVPELRARLRANPPARVADIGCGTGWSSIAIARAYPKVRVEGFDLDDASIEEARANAEAAGVADRVTFAVRDAADPDAAGRYDLVTVFEAVHDMGRPADALRAIRGIVREGGAVLVADERVGEAFSAPGDEIERLNYGFSALHCLPATMAEDTSSATGTVMRPPILRAYAAAAGFSAVEVLPIENDFWRFYRLVP